MAEYRYQRLDMTRFILTTPAKIVYDMKFIQDIIDKPLKMVNDTYIPFVVEKYNRNQRTHTRVAWVIFNLRTKTIEVIHDPTKIISRFLPVFEKELEENFDVD